MKYKYLAIAIFCATLSAMCASLMEHFPDESASFGAGLVALAICALAFYGLYILECIKDDHKAIMFPEQEG